MTERWWNSAKCIGMTQLFFARDEESTTIRQMRESRAKAICAECPVQHECLQSALANAESGIWGGTTERERQRMMRTQRRLTVARPVPSRKKADPAWRIIETRTSLSGRSVDLKIIDQQSTWHGFCWGVFRGDEMVYLADNEPDAWLYFHSTVLC